MKMTCKDCIFNEICERREDLVQLDDFTWDEYGESNEVEEYCSIFRSKADFVEIVRCENCKYCESYICGFIGERLYSCIYSAEPCAVAPEHFCGYGERKKEKE